MPRVPLKPDVERFFPAAKAIEDVLASQRLWLRAGHRLGSPLLEDAWLREQIAQAAWNLRGPVQKLGELLPLGLLKPELGPVGEDAPRLGDGSHANEVAELGFGHITGGTNKRILRA